LFLIPTGKLASTNLKKLRKRKRTLLKMRLLKETRMTWITKLICLNLEAKDEAKV